ncbi:MAG: TIGR04282 family arsenosugar biosynthesis glycosyltransferase, partial [Verrucomicrobiota bacterium]
MKRLLLVFLKYPRPGRVKTRLAEAIGTEEAAIAYRMMVARTLELCGDSFPEVIAIAFDPLEEESEIQVWLEPLLSAFPGEINWIPQVTGDLGRRMEVAVETTCKAHPDAVVAVVGTDMVHLDRFLVEEAWNVVEEDSNKVVFGPSEDGGYYLLALQKFESCLFREIPWSTSTTLEASLAAAEARGLATHLLEKRFDVDSIEEWKQVEPELR